MPPTSSTLTPLSILLRLLIMFNFCWVRMVGAYKVHLPPSLKSSIFLRQLRDNILTTVKNIFILVNIDFVKPFISNVLFRVYCTEEMIDNAASTMAATRMEPYLDSSSLSLVLRRIHGDISGCWIKRISSAHSSEPPL